MHLLKSRKLRWKWKRLLKKSLPLSSVLYDIAVNYKQWEIKYLDRKESFYSSHFMRITKPIKTYDVVKQQILLAGDVELNPGPQLVNTTHSISFSNPNFVLNYRMLRHGLRPVNGGRDCLFKSISHQLYNDSSRHVDIRALGVRYLTDHPERFIESVVDTPWSQYLSHMSKQGTWADNIVIQAVSDAMNSYHRIKSKFQ